MRFYVWLPTQPEHAVTLDAPTAEQARTTAAAAMTPPLDPSTLSAWPTSYGRPNATRTRHLSVFDLDTGEPLAVHAKKGPQAY